MKPKTGWQIYVLTFGPTSDCLRATLPQDRARTCGKDCSPGHSKRDRTPQGGEERGNFDKACGGHLVTLQGSRLSATFVGRLPKDASEPRGLFAALDVGGLELRLTRAFPAAWPSPCACFLRPESSNLGSCNRTYRESGENKHGSRYYSCQAVI